MSNHYKKRPSELLDVCDSYTAFCLDEACEYIEGRIQSGDTPVYRKKARSFHEIYQNFEKGAGTWQSI
ncbi:hypothetical protein [Massiliimalia timonensis]|uniref:Uncharacterized protein n=1 Tax=Massiliimalia timonensis TaxID=1987501 RepID=A0A8J6PGD0_9FIRM|nr:hypothetical protein [Massiliimalia timonensis]MBC8612046.1 hypothetical protein [Massiliimalia timonensis]MBS7176642.1 hypothetical protein [Clostridiales bacterium]